MATPMLTGIKRPVSSRLDEAEVPTQKREKIEREYIFWSCSGVAYKVIGVIASERICPRCPVDDLEKKERGIAQIQTDCELHPSICVRCFFGQQERKTCCYTCPEPTFKNEKNKQREDSLAEILSEASVTCITCPEDKPWKGKFSEIQRHENEVNHVIACPNQGCKVTISAHLMSCIHSHRQECAEEQHFCQNKGCSEISTKDQMGEHTPNCMFTPVTVNGIETTVGARDSVRMIIVFLTEGEISHENLQFVWRLFCHFGSSAAALLAALKAKLGKDDNKIEAVLDLMIKAALNAPNPLSPADKGKLLVNLMPIKQQFQNCLINKLGLGIITDAQSTLVTEYCCCEDIRPHAEKFDELLDILSRLDAAQEGGLQASSPAITNLLARLESLQ